MGCGAMPLTFDLARMQHGVHAKYGTAFHGDPPVAAASSLATIAAQVQPGYQALEALRLRTGQDDWASP